MPFEENCAVEPYLYSLAQFFFSPSSFRVALRATCARRMSGTDATVMVVGPLLDIVDDEWRADTLPEDGESAPAMASTSHSTNRLKKK